MQWEGQCKPLKRTGQGYFSNLQVGLRAKELALGETWVALAIETGQQMKAGDEQVDWEGAEEPPLSTHQHLPVSSSSTLKGEPKSIPRHQDPSLLLPLTFSVLFTPPTLLCHVCTQVQGQPKLQWSPKGIECPHLRDRGQKVSYSAKVIGKSWTTWRTSPFPKLLLLNLLTSRAELKPPEQLCAPILLMLWAPWGGCSLPPGCQAAFPGAA